MAPAGWHGRPGIAMDILQRLRKPLGDPPSFPHVEGTSALAFTQFSHVSTHFNPI
jgi:hypothetical protein